MKAEDAELTTDGEAHLKRFGSGSSDDSLEAFLFIRENTKGVHFERWRHAHGFRKWFHAARHAVTKEVYGTYPSKTAEPPADILAEIKKRTA